MTAKQAIKNLSKGKHIDKSKSVLEARKRVLQTNLATGSISNEEYVTETTQINLVLHR